MTYKINSDSYKVKLENEKGEITTISIDANDIEQADSLLGILDSFDTTLANIDKRTKKLKKQYDDERVLVRQQLRIVTEELDNVNKALDDAFGDGLSEKIFLGKKSVVMYMNFFSMLEKEFKPAIEKAEKQQEALMKEWDEKYTQHEDDVL